MQAAPPGERLAFVTHNKSDFGAQNARLQHPDIASTFSRVKSMYFINLAEVLRRIDPSMVSQLVWEQSWEMEPPGLHELLKSEDLLFHRVWHNRHWNLRHEIETGKVKVVDHATWVKRGGNNSKYIVDT